MWLVMNVVFLDLEFAADRQVRVQRLVADFAVPEGRVQLEQFLQSGKIQEKFSVSLLLVM